MAATTPFCFLVMVVMAGAPDGLLFTAPALVSGADVSLGTILRASDTAQWTSPSKTFSFGFTKYQQNPSLFVAGVTHSASTILVWTAGDASPAVVDGGASLNFSSDGNLRLLNGSGTVVWQSLTGNKGVSVAAVEDSGNFFLKNGSSTVWDTFSYPADVVVQQQNFLVGQALRSGLYSFEFVNSTVELRLKWNISIVYWSISNSSIAGKLTSPALVLDATGVVTLVDPLLSAPSKWIYSSDYSSESVKFRFLRLDSDGNLRAYSFDGKNLSPQWSAVEDQCLVYGWCGNNGMCVYNDTKPVCTCLSQDFVPVDSGDPRQGCKRKQLLGDCPDNISMLELKNTIFLTYPPDTGDINQYFFIPFSPCKENCLRTGGACSGSTSLDNGSGRCFFKIKNFISAYQSSVVPSTSFVKVCGLGVLNPDMASAGGSSKRGSPHRGIRVVVIVIVIVATLSSLICLETVLWWWLCRRGNKFGGLSSQYALLEYASGAPVQFSYKELHQATKGFKETLGAGGFGQVYRGTLGNRTIVAVKRLEGIEQGEKQFRMEVAAISSTHHLNLVRLIGFCSEGRHRLLVYEFMRNGSLDSFIFSDNAARLDWDARFRIALGTARGIAYLHEECRDCIVHCDIKPENILLDDNYNAKVSDFGLAKLINHKDNQYRTLTSVRGTRGYLAPEWRANLPITSKSDVYSFGMVLLEMISGRRNFDVSGETGMKKFSSWAFEEFERGNIERIVDNRILKQADMEQVLRAVQASFWCIQEQPSQRPHMGKVVQMLEGILVMEKPPAPSPMDATPSYSSNSASVASNLSSMAASAQPLSSSPSFKAFGSSVSVLNPERNFSSSSSLVN
ncbi:G-type lectin S-receptor-like serine/threonine-protein kinase [Nymphaea thermarum]|nr:G-type lectin S-receptor-like serine/threonine-protein kinase [Nymphaea thermarum]